jgi:hypothetical protein
LQFAVRVGKELDGKVRYRVRSCQPGPVTVLPAATNKSGAEAPFSPNCKYSWFGLILKKLASSPGPSLEDDKKIQPTEQELPSDCLVASQHI